MKLVKTSLVALLLTSALCASAQEKINMIKAGGNMLFLLDEGQDEEVQTLGGASLALEHPLGKQFSLVLGFNYNAQKQSKQVGGGFVQKTRQMMFTFDPELRWYPKAATDGFYLGIAPEIYMVKYKYSGTAFTGTENEVLLGASLKTGYQFTLTETLKLQVGTGLGFSLEVEDSGPRALANFNALIGYQF